jgi:DNA-binding beta-propeller fold protein YncE
MAIVTGTVAVLRRAFCANIVPRKILIAMTMLVLTPFPALAADTADALGYRLVAARPLTDTGTGWDHVSIDPQNRHVFIGRGQAGLAVLDADTGDYILSVVETAGSHGAAIASDLGLGFSDNGKGGDLTIFDLKTLQPKAHLHVGDTTDGVFYDPATKTALVNNGETGQVTLFDPSVPSVLATLDLKTKKPEFAAVDGRGNAFIDLQDRNSVARIDLTTRTIAEIWPLAGCDLPSSMVYDSSSDRLFVGCRGSAPVMVAVDPRAGRVVATVPIGLGNDWAGFDPKTHLARTGAIDPTTGVVFLVSAQYSRPGPGADGKSAPNHIYPGTTDVLVFKRLPTTP